MVSAIATSLSGLTAASTRLQVAAQNIANASSTETTANGNTTNTPYVPQRVVQSTTAGGGVIAATQPVNPPSVPTLGPNGTVAQTPNVDVTQNLVQENLASYDFQGNLNVVKVEEKNFDSLINIVS